ncbi:MAG: GC-type dockerin domain-anchored protein, partial [Phycisphaerales bacterium]
MHLYRAIDGQLLRTLVARDIYESGSFGGDVTAVPPTTPGGVFGILISAHTAFVPPSPNATGRAFLVDAQTGETRFSFQSLHETFGLNFSREGVLGAARLGPNAEPACLVCSSDSRDAGGSVYVFAADDGELLHQFVNPLPQYRDYGYVVALMPDLTGDGIEEILISFSAERLGPAPTDIGTVYVYSGSTWEQLMRIPHRAFAMAGLPDITGDGVPDIALGNQVEPPSDLPEYAGVVRMISGATGEVFATLTAPQPQQYGAFGASIGAARDLDHDGVADLVVSEHGAFYPEFRDPVGQVHVFSGASLLPLRTIRHPFPANGSGFGGRLLPIPDCNGDGIDEVAISAGNDWPGQNGRPRQAYIFLSCPADWDADGEATAADFFGFLNSFFSLDQYADFNRDGLVNSQDFFDYLSAFFA